MLISLSPCTIHCARYLPQPAPAAMPMDAPQHCQKFRSPAAGPSRGLASGVWGDRAAHDAPDARVAPDRHPLHHPLDVGSEPVEVRLEQLVLRIPLRPAAAMGPALGRVRGLVDADEPRLLLLAVVGRGRGVAHHHHLLVALHELPDRLGDEVGMLHVGDRHVGPRHPAHLPRVAPGRVHHHLAHHVALVGDDLPFAVRALLQVRHPGAAGDGRAHVPRALGERVAAAGGVHVAVPGGPRAREDPLDAHERIDLPDLLRVDDLAVEADELADAGDVVEPLHLRRLEGEPDTAASVPAHVLPGLLLQLRVEPDPVVVDLRHVVVGDEARALARRVPRRAGRDLALLHEQDVGPSLLGQMVEEPGPHHSSTDDDDSRVCLHGILRQGVPGVQATPAISKARGAVVQPLPGVA